MKSLFDDIWKSAAATLVLAAVLCGIYPAAVYALGQLFFPRQANGSLIEAKDRTVIGSALLGQNFTAAKYFQPRPSAAGSAGYDASSSGGTNLGPTSRKLIDQVKERVAAYRSMNGMAADALVPADAVTASGSGLDPHISVQNAQLQALRVARERGLSNETVQRLIEKHTEGRQLGVLGEPGVNVLALNLELDEAGLASSQH